MSSASLVQWEGPAREMGDIRMKRRRFGEYRLQIRNRLSKRLARGPWEFSKNIWVHVEKVECDFIVSRPVLEDEGL